MDGRLKTKFGKAGSPGPALNMGGGEGSIVGWNEGPVGSKVGSAVGFDVGVSKLDDDIILLVSFNCSDR